MKRILLLLSISILTVYACNHQDESVLKHEETQAIYQYDDSLQCEAFDKQGSIDEMRLELINAGIDVVEYACGNDGQNHAAVCGGKTGNINVFYIHSQNLADAKALGYGELRDLDNAQLVECEPAKVAAVDIYQYDGSVQCELGFDKPGSINTMLDELTNAGIAVSTVSCGNDGLNYVAVCGGNTGNINVFRVDAQRLADAKALGFEGLQVLENPILHSCPPL